VITAQARFAEVWPETAVALRGYLRARGSSHVDVEDMLQECAVRVLHARPTFVDAQDLIRWCLPVVRNLSVDQYRRGRRELPFEAVPDRAGRSDLADDVSHSLELGRVLRALQQLKPSDRDVILAHVEQDAPIPLDRKQAVRLNVQRHRARQRLLARLAAVLGVGLALVRRGGRVAAPVMLPAALALGLFTADVSLFAGGQPGRAASPSRLPVSADQVTAVTHGAPAAQVGSPVRRTGQPPVHRRTSPSTRSVVSAAAPTGDRAAVLGRDRPHAGVTVCAWGVWPLPDTCVSSPGDVRG
jgi:DNA-directed RNA polymerase specialized sigma24 family protein